MNQADQQDDNTPRLRSKQQELSESEECYRQLIVGVARDITDQRHAESQLRLLSTALQAAANAIVITDREGKILWANEAFTRLTGYELVEVQDAPTRMLKSGQHDPEFYRRLWSTIVSGEVWKGEIVNRRKDGSLYTEEMTITPVTDEQGEITHFIAIKQDITLRKESEKIRLKHVKVEQERNHLRDAVKALERVLGVVGHELRTPLGSVRTLAELMLKQEICKSEESEAFIRNIRDEVVRMSQLVDDLLEVARLNSGTAQWAWTEVVMKQVGEEALRSVRPLVDLSRVQLKLHVQRPDLRMKGDAGAIRRLLGNLIHNACKHTPEGSILVEVREQTYDDRPWIEIRVSDTGEGMRADVAARLGIAFALNSGVVGENHVRGSGLGLAICKGIVTAHGGHISVDTIPGGGTTMTVLLDAELPEPAPTNNSSDYILDVGQPAPQSVTP